MRFEELRRVAHCLSHRMERTRIQECVGISLQQDPLLPCGISINAILVFAVSIYFHQYWVHSSIIVIRRLCHRISTLEHYDILTFFMLLGINICSVAAICG